MPADQFGNNLSLADQQMNLTDQEKNLYQYHLNNLYGPGAVWHQNGAVSTIYQTVVPGPGGKFYNIPTVWGGKILTTDQAYDLAAQKGWDHWPSYNTPEQADARYMQMHEYMANDVSSALYLLGIGGSLPASYGSAPNVPE